MKLFLDTNVLLRMFEPGHQHHSIFQAALNEHLPDEWCVSSQTIYEFLAVATRLVNASGLGITAVAADAGLMQLLSRITVLFDSQAISHTLRSLVVNYGA